MLPQESLEGVRLRVFYLVGAFLGARSFVLICPLLIKWCLFLSVRGLITTTFLEQIVYSVHYPSASKFQHLVLVHCCSHRRRLSYFCHHLRLFCKLALYQARCKAACSSIHVSNSPRSSGQDKRCIVCRPKKFKNEKIRGECLLIRKEDEIRFPSFWFGSSAVI